MLNKQKVYNNKEEEGERSTKNSKEIVFGGRRFTQKIRGPPETLPNLRLINEGTKMKNILSARKT